MNNYKKVVREMRRAMFFPRTAVVPACAAFWFAALSLPAFCQSSVGLVGGITSDSASGKPVAQAKITAHNLNKNTDIATVSGADGIFTFTNLEPGQYEVAATKDGFQKSSVQVQVAALRTARVDLPLQIAADVRGTTVKSDAPLTEREKQLLDRLDLLEKRLAAMEVKDANATQTAATKTAEGNEPLLASLAPVARAPLAPLPPAPVPAPAPAAMPQAPAPAPPAPAVPEALQSPDPAPPVDNDTPFAFGDFTWVNGAPRNKDTVLDTKFFTPEVRFDTNYTEDANQPKDHTLGGSTETFRNGEVQVEQISVGGDFHWQNVRGRVLTMAGMFATTTPRNDASFGVGQWDTRDAYRYVSEAWGGYHFNVNHGLNIDAGIFVSYIGLFSYYNYDNWAYQPSFVSSNTPWFFNGLRVQWFPTNKLKIEPWFINGWQSYNKFNGHPGLGGQILWTPKEWIKLVFNNYGMGTDTLGVPGRSRLHTDDSILVRYYNHPESTGISKMAFTITADAGCEYGGGVTCHGGKAGPEQAFLGTMGYNRIWFNKDKYAITLGGGTMTNPGLYLTLLPPINGADAVSGSVYFPEAPGLRAKMWDGTATFDYMPKQYITWRFETGFRHSNIPYWTGRQGITPPGGNTGAPADYVCAAGGSSGTGNLAQAEAACGGGPGSVWFPDLRKGQFVATIAVMVKF